MKNREGGDRAAGRDRLQLCVPRPHATDLNPLRQSVRPYKKSAGSPAPEVYRLPFPSDHSGVHGEDLERSVNELFLTDVEPTAVAAIIVEPVQGEGGFNPVSTEMFGLLAHVVLTGTAYC